MKKADKKIENSARKALAEVCELALDEVAGFKWITHIANYSSFPDSLSVVCVFDTNSDLSNAYDTHNADFLRSLIKEKLSNVVIQIKYIRQHVTFDAEEACQNENGGKCPELFS